MERRPQKRRAFGSCTGSSFSSPFHRLYAHSCEHFYGKAQMFAAFKHTLGFFIRTTLKCNPRGLLWTYREAHLCPGELMHVGAEE